MPKKLKPYYTFQTKEDFDYHNNCYKIEARRLAENEIKSEVMKQQLNMRVAALVEATKTLSCIAESVCRVATSIENITCWPR